MKTMHFTIGLLICLFTNSISAQETTTITKTSEVQLQLPASYSKTLGLYIFPEENQTKQVQADDEKQCYIWAYEQTGFDPLNPTKIVAKKVDGGPSGAAVVGAAKGAAAGAAIGAVTGDAGNGAAIGAIAGTLRGRRAAKNAEYQQQQVNNAEAAKQQEALMTNFKKAFSSCIQAKKYTVN